MSSGAVSRCKLARSTNLSPYLEFTCEECACPGTETSRKLSRRLERFAKTVTNKCRLLSVLWGVILFIVLLKKDHIGH